MTLFQRLGLTGPNERGSGKLTAFEPMNPDELADVIGGNQLLSKLQQAELNQQQQPVFQSAIDEFLADTDEE
jgi:hypothetical protein